MIDKRNPFRNVLMRSNFDSCIQMFEKKHSNLFGKDGLPSRNNGIASVFWKGYYKTMWGRGFDTPDSRNSIAYPMWLAGRRCGAANGIE